MDWNLPLLLDNEADEEDHVDESNHQTLVLSLKLLFLTIVLLALDMLNVLLALDKLYWSLSGDILQFFSCMYES
jgi:hypothetical protein